MLIFKFKKSSKISVRVAKLTHSPFLFNLFNQSIKKGFSITTDRVDHKTHSNWFKNKLKDEFTQIYIVYLNLSKIGYVRFEEFSQNKYKVSIANHPNFIGKGYGSIILNLAIKKFVTHKVNVSLHALIRKNNIPSIKIFTKNNFVIKKKIPKVLSNEPIKDLLCYELKQELKKKEILFLGYTDKRTILIKFLEKKKFKVIQHGNKNLNLKKLNKYFCIISFGYKKIIKQNIISKLKKPILNLHIAYLPYNRGAHPNYWSFAENTPNGISIHEIDRGIDTGKLVLRKKMMFKNIKEKTFQETYEILKSGIEKLFIQNHSLLINGLYKAEQLKLKGTIHYQKELPKNLTNWNVKILDYLKNNI